MITKGFMIDGIPTLTVEEVQKLENTKLIDVRMSEEYVGELGHIEGSDLITLGLELDHFLSKENIQTPIIFICRSGVRSGKATALALARGFKNIYNMEGGMIAWNNSSLPVTK